ncbi:S41 family peptidase [Luteimonas gilva]|uniref:S41 family peptidase n=2 Tax=Luteimonas gilva TaxID=2572684 RepID=A0A4U5K0W7_9GAMM|nr:S41 family peptidase [Luteimonas gilva]TKR34227.1 S41 family peptidase [Luteimonas gilva]
MSGEVLLAALLAACPQQAEVLDGVAKAVEQTYVAEAEAGLIAESVRDWSKRHRYADACGDWAAFAERLNRDLDAYDGHFFVERIASGPESKPEADWLMAWRAEAGPSNAGVREVKVFEGNVGYLRLTTFYPWDLAKTKLSNAFALLKDTEGMILDLRQNGGGDADTAAQLVRAFLGDGIKAVQRIESRKGTKTEDLPARDMAGYSRGLVVLVDRRSGSAAEYVAYSLQAEGRASVIGSRSGGVANLMDEPQPLPHGFKITIPNAKPVNMRTGKNWEGSGVTPDMKGGDDPIYAARQFLSGRSAPAPR